MARNTKFVIIGAILFLIALLPTMGFFWESRRIQVVEGKVTSAGKINWLSLSKTRYNRHELHNASQNLLVENIHIQSFFGGHTTYHFLNGQPEEVWIWNDGRVHSKIKEGVPKFETRKEEAKLLLDNTRKRFMGVIGTPGVDTEIYEHKTYTIKVISP